MDATTSLQVARVRRRALLAWSSIGLAGLIGLAYAAASVRFVVPAGRKPGADGAGGENVGLAAGFKVEVPTRVPLDIDAQGRPQGGGWVVRHPDGTFSTFDMHCTHLSCPYEWSSPGGADGVFACPCHGSVFRKDGSVEHGPAFIPLRTRRTTVSGGNVLVGGIGGGESKFVVPRHRGGEGRVRHVCGAAPRRRGDRRD